MALWIDDDGLVNIQYDGHMCIHEMLHARPNEYVESQSWLDEVLPSVDVVHVEINYFNLHMIEDHIKIMQIEYPNIKRIVVSKTLLNFKIPEYVAGFVIDTMFNKISTIQRSNYINLHAENLQINTDTEVIIDEELSIILPKSIPNHHTRLLLREMENMFWNKIDLDSYTRIPNTTSHVYPIWFRPLNKSNGAIVWDDILKIIHNNISKEFNAS